MTGPILKLLGATGASGPLLFIRGGRGLALGERVVVELPDGPPRSGQLVEVGEDAAVVQMLEDTVGLSAGKATITLTGEVPRAVVGSELVGRVLSGGGRALDGLPDPVGEALLPLTGAPLNPARRLPPSDFIETGISAVDGLDTLVRGQKLPVFSGPGLPGMELAARLATWARAPRGEPFAVVFVGLGVTDREARRFLKVMEDAGVGGETTVYLNLASDPTIERLLAPRMALTQAEFLAFERGLHVLVVIADILHYCDALREVAAAREEIPGRRGYPGYMYTDLASLFERAGIAEGRSGSVTQIPILTMPDDDITHPIPDLTGYITEGQLVLGRELHRRGVWPPIDVLPSLSRLMNAGIGPERTVPEHREWANQLYALYARGREARLTAAIVGEGSLGAGDREAIGFADRFERELVGQGEVRRTIGETMDIGWALIETFPHEELTRISEATWATRRAPMAGVDARPGPEASGERAGAMKYKLDSRPTRLNLLRARRRLERVREGSDLLRRKREALVRELLRQARPAVSERERIERTAAVAYPALVDALAREGSSGVRASAEPLREVAVTMSSAHGMGARGRIRRGVPATRAHDGGAGDGARPDAARDHRGRGVVRDARAAPRRGRAPRDAASQARPRGRPDVAAGARPRAARAAGAGVRDHTDDGPAGRAGAGGASEAPPLPPEAESRRNSGRLDPHRVITRG